MSASAALANPLAPANLLRRAEQAAQEFRTLAAEFTLLAASITRYTASARAAEEAATAAAEALTSTPPPSLQLRVAQPTLALVSAQTLAIAPAVASVRWPVETSKTTKELIEYVTPALAARSLLEQARGLPQRGFASAIALATINARGCWLSQARRLKRGGHCQMTPFVARSTTRSRNGEGAVAQKRMHQLLHRLAVRAWASADKVLHMVEDSWDVSHLCHNPNCFNIGHLVVEPHQRNMMRRACAGGAKCECTPPCRV